MKPTLTPEQKNIAGAVADLWQWDTQERDKHAKELADQEEEQRISDTRSEQDFQLSQSRAKTAFNKQQTDKEKEYQLARINYATDFKDRLSQIEADKNKSLSEAEDDYNKSVADGEEQRAHERLKRAEDLAKDLERLARDHNDKLYDLVRVGDVRGILTEMRDYKKAKSDKIEDAGGTEKEADYQEAERRKQLKINLDNRRKDILANAANQLADAKQNFEREQKQRDDAHKLEMDKNVTDFNDQQSLETQQHDEDVKIAERRRREDLARAFKAWTDQHNAEALAKGIGILQMAGVLTTAQKQIEDHYIALLGLATNYVSKLKALEPDLYSWISLKEAAARAGDSGYTGGQDSYGSPASGWGSYNTGSWGTSTGGSTSHTGQTGGWGYASGGYIGTDMMIRAGESGKEFMLNNFTTRKLEGRLGNLTQEKFLDAFSASGRSAQGGGGILVLKTQHDFTFHGNGAEKLSEEELRQVVREEFADSLQAQIRSRW
jgi:hypothetical protein